MEIGMALASLQRPSLFSAGHGRCCLTRKVRSPCSFSLRALNGDDSTPEERARISLKELDEQLLSTPPPPREFPGIVIEDKQKEVPLKEKWLILSDRFFIYLTGGLFLLTIVNNLLFYFFVELPHRKLEATQEKVIGSNNPSVNSSDVAPQLQAQSEM